MKKLIALAAALALAGCGDNEVEDVDVAAQTAEADGSSGVLTGEEPGFEAVAPGTYEVTRPGNQVDYIEIHEGMTFSRVAADGTATGGSIYMKDGKICFLVEGNDQPDCFTDEQQPDGTIRTTSESGDVSTVRPVEGALGDYVGPGSNATPTT